MKGAFGLRPTNPPPQHERCCKTGSGHSTPRHELQPQLGWLLPNKTGPGESSRQFLYGRVDGLEVFQNVRLVNSKEISVPFVESGIIAAGCELTIGRHDRAMNNDPTPRNALQFP